MTIGACGKSLSAAGGRVGWSATKQAGSVSNGCMTAWLHAFLLSTIAFTRAPDATAPWPTTDVYVMNGDGSGVRALTRDGHSHNPSWLPDGRRILFVHDSTLQGRPAYPEPLEFASHHPVELQVMDAADGGNRRLLRRIEPVIYGAAASPDGKAIAVTCLAGRPATPASPADPMQAGLYLLSSDGSGELRLLFRNAYTPAWSPDGKRLAFSVEKPRGQWAVHVANANGTGGSRQLTDPRRLGGSPAWSPDGRRVAFSEQAASGGGGTGGQQPRQQQVFVMNTDGSQQRQLTRDPNWSCDAPSWSPDGKRIIASCRAASAPCGSALPGCVRRIFSIDATGSAEGGAKMVQLTDRDGALPAFAPAARH